MLASTLRLAGAVRGALTFGFTVALGLYADHALLYLTFVVAAGLLGALVAARKPRSSVGGWLMCIASLAAVLLYLPHEYGYVAVVARHDSWPLCGAAVWLAAWVMGSRSASAAYPERDRDVLQRSADLVSEALALAAHLCYLPLPRSQGARRL